MRPMDLFDRTARRRGAQCFAYCGAVVISYDDAAVLTAEIAAGLQQRGIGPNDVVAIFSPNSLEMLLAFMACWRLGALPQTVDLSTSAADLPPLLNEVTARALLFAEAKRSLLTGIEAAVPSLRALVVLEGDADRADSLHGYAKQGRGRIGQLPGLADDGPLFLSYTSGSTGRPKGVVLNWRPVVRATACIAERIGLTDEDVTLCAVPMASSYPLVANILPSFHTGATLGIAPSWAPRELHAGVQARQVTVLIAYPLTLADYVQDQPTGAAEHAAPRLRLALSGGSPVPVRTRAEYRERLGIRLVEGYGQSELGGFVACGGPSERLDDGHPWNIGRPLPDREVRVVDEADREVPPGELGEFVVCEGYMAGYWQRPEAEAETLRNGWLHCGDVGVIDERGRARVVGRRHEAVWADGQWLFPRHVEERLYEHPGVLHAAALAVGSEADRRFIGVVAPRPGATIDAEALRQHCASALPASAVPPAFHLVDPIPRTFSGKVNRLRLKQELAG